MEDFEKLGAFYLGRTYDLANRRRGDHLLLYDSKDLVTHAVCVGMTGSGKTGLCLTLLEEAAIDGIPAIAIDPKGDLSNLLLTFPELRGTDFAPWVSAEEAAKKGVGVGEFADKQAALWKKGLEEWGQSGERIRKLRESADFAIYTPASNAGLPVSILKSFAAPDAAVREDEEALRERIATTATSLLGLLGIEGDPIRSREHILLSTLLNAAWGSGRDLDLAALIQQIQTPPVARVGVMDLESFFPAKERFALAMQLNNLLAAPGFSAWMEGEPLDVGSLLHTPEGKPRISIFSIAHLGDAERMFFVSLLLNQILGWVRTQSGTGSLRAIVYMDEIAGYFPPTANPPSKRPLLTLMKQARAFGVGVVLATQNPVDLDYKGLANAGTWFIGRLQTERDKLRVLDGLEGAAASASARFDRGAMEKLLSQLGSRVFLMNDVHEDGPEVFETRWALSYLAGPLTRKQIQQLMETRRSGAKGAAAGSDARATAPVAAPTSPRAAAPSARAERPVLPPDVPQLFIPMRGARPAGRTVSYAPALYGSAKVYFSDPKLGIDEEQTVAALVRAGEGAVAVDFESAEIVDLPEGDLEREPADGASFAALPPELAKAKSYESWRRSFADWLYRTAKLECLRSAELGLVSKPNETERDFKARLQLAARERRDEAAEKLRQKYAPKIAAIQERIRRAEQAVQVQQAQARESQMSSILQVGTAILGAFLGRKTLSAGNVGKAATAARGMGRAYKESGDVARAGDTVEALKQQAADLDAQFQADLEAQGGKADAAAETLERIALRPKKTNITIRALALAWSPQ